MKSMMSLNTLRAVASITLLCSLVACASTEPQGPDEAIARNMAAMQARPTATDLDWREPKAVIDGKSAAALPVNTKAYPDDAALAEALAYSQTHAGKGMMVWYDGNLVQSEFTEGVDATTPFASYSMHKSVLAIAILAAIEDGMIDSLDEPVRNYIKEWRRDARGDITLRQLLNHNSGLKHFDFSSEQAIGINLSSRIREAALEYPLDGTLGEMFEYNNVNSMIAGIALSAALEKRKISYEEYLSQRLWKPLGNQDAALWLDRENDGTARYQSGLEAGLSDWLNIGVMLANGGRLDGETILSAESMAELVKPSATNPAYGLHIWLGDAWQAARSYGPSTAAKVIHSKPYLAPDVWFFDGFGGQRVYVVPSRKLVVARFGEVDFTYDDSAVLNILLRGLIDAEAAAARANFKSPSNEAAYSARFAELMKAAQTGQGLGGYDPLIPLPGSADYQAWPVQPADWLDANTTNQISALADASNTTAIQVWHDGNLIFEDYDDDNGPTTPMVSRSLSKPLSVVAVGRAIKAGYITSLDQPAADFLTEWSGTAKEKITLRQLLQMRSGLAPQGSSRDPEDIMHKAYLHPYHAEIIINEYPLTTIPGERYDYSNANAELIAPIIQRATGRTYEAWLTEQVLQPLDAAGGQIWVNRIGGTTHSGCCAMLPTETWLRLSVLLVNNGVWQGEQLLPDGFVTEMTTPTSQYPHAAMGLYVAGDYIEYRGHSNPDVPYSKVLHSEPYLAEDIFLFDGNGNQVSYIVPSHDLVILRLGRTPPKGTPWDNPKLPNMILSALAENTNATLTPQSN